MGEKTIYVYENWSGENPVLIGKLYTSSVRGKEQFSFEYDTSWLVSESACRKMRIIKKSLRIYETGI